ncbi:MAG: alpha/beta hydrolase [Planctomycetes bacterium]|nr:alpha/beta hydrolase [Planctomycetota bacterium]
MAHSHQGERQPRSGRLVVASALLLLLGLPASACAVLRSPAKPMPCSFHPAPATPDAPTARCLLVLLPGIGDSIADLVDRGMLAAVRDRRIAADVLIADAHFGYYRTRTAVQRIWEDVLEPRIAAYDEVWLAGVSLGGFGALLCASDIEVAKHAPITGVIAVGPYLGGDEVADDVLAAGGLRSWSPPAGEQTVGQRVFGWLRGYGDPTVDRPRMFLGIGSNDSLLRQSRAAATILPATHVLEVSGGHDWTAFLAIWQQLLDRAPLPRFGRT